MKNNLDKAMKRMKNKNQTGIMAHLVTGYPTLEFSKKIAEALIKGGADIIEIQIPFSDPMADGPLIVEACQESLDNGTTIRDSFKLAQFINSGFKTPIVLMTYANIPIRLGIQSFCILCKKYNISGLIVPDLPYDSDECKILKKYTEELGIHFIYVVSPSTEDKRLKEIKKQASGLIYCTSRQGTTGAGQGFAKNLISYLARVGDKTPIPLAVGFGVSSSRDLGLIKKHAQVGVIGSAIIDIINKHKNSEILPAVNKFIYEIRK